ncbi:hypothetical protein HYFRA_00009649 [Hymenoscyphus fraxineus]|uniref:DUF6590 domain-containing protein n=1 Tax=Hymenoscyphus fraxineus TaxID=746836 RepID=A0A9N9KUU5_9HELO|nr:hypothetical protein HYFRA_00009649 [Hymenoscyphus fraxineus]
MSKHHREKATEWSAWNKHPDNGKFYCYRTNSSGQTEYYYREDEPRTIPEASNSSGGGYTDNSSYGYGASSSQYPSVDGMTSAFASTNLSSSSGYTVPASTSTTIGSSSSTQTPYQINYNTTLPTTPLGYGLQTSQWKGNNQYASNTTGPSATPYQSNYTSSNSTFGSSAPYYSANAASNLTTGSAAPYYSSNTGSSLTTGAPLSYYPEASGSTPSTSTYTYNTGDPKTSDAYQEGGSGQITPREKGPPLNSKVIPKSKYEKFDSNFKVHHSKDFKPGAVIKLLWSEPRGETSYAYKTNVTAYKHETGSQSFHTKMRRFIVISVGKGYCQCVPILTYQHQATRKSGVRAEEHAAVYVRGSAPRAIEGEDALTNEPIEIAMRTIREKLDAESRIHYAKTYCVEHNLKINIIGDIAPEFRKRFSADLEKIQGTMEHI